MVSPGDEDGATSEPNRVLAGVRADAPPLDIGSVRRLVILAARPGDGSLMASGLSRAVASAGRPVLLAVMTSAGSEAVRAAEAPHPAVEIELLPLPGGDPDGARDELAAAVATLVGPGDTVVAPWRLDGPAAHEALGTAAAVAVAAAGATLLEAPIEAWHRGASDLLERRAVRFDPVSDAPAERTIAATATSCRRTGASGELFFPSAPLPVDFDAMYAGSDDPWGFEERWYERRKRALTIASLPLQRYGRALEIGCSTGLLAEALLERVDDLLAVDGAERAVELAARRFRDRPRVRVERRRLPTEWPTGRFDLVVLSETGFYLSRQELVDLAGRMGAALAPGGQVLACHWRPHVVGLELAGDEVHAVLRDRLGFEAIARHVEDDFLLEVLAPRGTASVARATGLR